MDWWVGEWIGVGERVCKIYLSIYIEEYKVWDDFGAILVL
jgi:hypothetical protein